MANGKFTRNVMANANLTCCRIKLLLHPHRVTDFWSSWPPWRTFSVQRGRFEDGYSTSARGAARRPSKVAQYEQRSERSTFVSSGAYFSQIARIDRRQRAIAPCTSRVSRSDIPYVSDDRTSRTKLCAI
jgi:hypothetical protein